MLSIPMKLFRFSTPDAAHLGLQTDDGAHFDLTSADPTRFGSLAVWLALPDPLGAAREIENRARQFPIEGEIEILAPLDEQEVWAAGVTYLRSKVARMEESEGGGDFYDLVYDAQRPELFLKATPHRVVGPNQAIRVRRDSSWDVPEPELTLVLAASGAIVGCTIGNDVSSRSIEGENPLYLPQAKVFDGGCALGPMILLGEEMPSRAIRVSIARGGERVFEGQTSTSQMRREPHDLAAWLFRELSFPCGAFLMTGTGVVPPDDFSLRAGDAVSITIEGVGELNNSVA